MPILSRSVCISDVLSEKRLFLRLVQGLPRVIRATNLTTQKLQNGKELFQLTQCNSPVRSCLLTILTYTTLHQEYMLCLFINRKWLGEGKERRRRDIFWFWTHLGLPFTLAQSQCYLLKYQSWLSFYIWRTESGIQQASSSTIVQALLLLTQ